jgi:NDP-sugar pyrophosphorylase family protein
VPIRVSTSECLSESLPPICILAGGRGTRLGSTVSDIPKPLLEVAGEPFLIHQLRLLARNGAREAVLSVGYLGEMIERRLGTEQCGIALRYSYDGPTPIGTLGAVRKAAPVLGDRFLVLLGDTYLRIDYQDVARSWCESGLPAVMTVLRNQGRWDTSNAAFDGRLVRYDKHSPDPAMEWIDYGLGGLSRAALDAVGPDISDLADLYQVLSSRGDLLGYAATNRFYEIGTAQALIEADTFLSQEHLGERH